MHVVYQDDTGVLVMGVDALNRLQLHSRYFVPMSHNQIKHCRWVLGEVEKGLKERGLTEYWTLVDSVESFKFSKLLGFESTKEVVNNKYEYMKKVIT